MKGISDTSPEAERVLVDVFRGMTPARKWQLLCDAYRTGRALHAANYRSRFPDATDREVYSDWMTATVGSPPLPADLEGVPVDPIPAENLQVVRDVSAVLKRLNIPHAVGGSIASSLHGVLRYTHDADLTAEPFPGREDEFVASFSDDYFVQVEAVRDAVRRRSSFNLIHLPTGFKVDIFVRKDRPFELSLIPRRVPKAISAAPGDVIEVVSAEDSVLLKLEWYRIGGQISDRQWNDILGVLKVQAGRLDDAYLDRWAAELGVSDLLAKARAEAAPVS